MPEKTPFYLKKWYFDGVDADGRAIIAYSATLRWHGIRVPYTGYLYLKEPGVCLSGNRFRQVTRPVSAENQIGWQDKGFRLQGQWDAASPAIRTRLYEGPEGYLDWHCLHPAAYCRIELGQERPITGMGYVECLEMTFPPWQLGLRELRWGRFAHAEFPVVWIDWKGELNRRWVFGRERLLTNATVTDALIALPEAGLNLHLEHPVVIEQREKLGEITRSLAAYLPGIDRLTPLRFLKSKETKWLSQGTLLGPGKPERQGLVIHELVTF
ncbi:MAG: hypothetical protein L6Q97_16660 [Thermoanaerobaculia bacterium]|nr:hypothetical protein [Thermoanaerobaculia bacterium]